MLFIDFGRAYLCYMLVMKSNRPQVTAVLEETDREHTNQWMNKMNEKKKKTPAKQTDKHVYRQTNKSRTNKYKNKYTIKKRTAEETY